MEHGVVCRHFCAVEGSIYAGLIQVGCEPIKDM